MRRAKLSILAKLGSSRTVFSLSSFHERTSPTNPSSSMIPTAMAQTYRGNRQEACVSFFGANSRQGLCTWHQSDISTMDPLALCCPACPAPKHTGLLRKHARLHATELPSLYICLNVGHDPKHDRYQYEPVTQLHSK